MKELATSGLDVLIIAISINIFTAITKLPIKKAAAKMKNGDRLKRFITFLPVIYGGVLSVVFRAITKSEIFGEGFVEQWLSASSLSLAIYAVFEKFLPSANKPLSQNEVEENAALIEKIGVASREEAGKNGREALHETTPTTQSADEENGDA